MARRPLQNEGSAMSEPGTMKLFWQTKSFDDCLKATSLFPSSAFPSAELGQLQRYKLSPCSGVRLFVFTPKKGLFPASAAALSPVWPLDRMSVRYQPIPARWIISSPGQGPKKYIWARLSARLTFMQVRCRCRAAWLPEQLERHHLETLCRIPWTKTRKDSTMRILQGLLSDGR